MAKSRSTSFAKAPATTGRYIIIYKDTADVKRVQQSLKQSGGLKSVPSSLDYESGAIPAKVLRESNAVHFAKLGIAVVTGQSEVQALSTSAMDADSPILAVEPEYIAYLTSPAVAGIEKNYLRGYRDAVSHLYDTLNGEEGTKPAAATVSSIFQDNDQLTWGLQATGVPTSRYSGQGIRIAVLDTGLDQGHPDFAGRSITTQSFSGVPVDDIHGHGTHCIGVACGPLNPINNGRRYGIAYNAEIFVGKVFDNAPEPGAPTGNIIAGIEWALTNNCRVASLSLGMPLDQQVMQYTVPFQQAMKGGMLIVAAAGNNARRPQNPGFVEVPANSDNAMAVAAIDAGLGIAPFSAQSSLKTGDGGKVNIAAPGVHVYSSYLVSGGRYAFLDGTSMATPHVAGIAALWAESTNETGADLWNRLLSSALPMTLSSADVGCGLVQAPQ